MSKRPHVVIFNPDSYRGDVLGHLDNPAAVTPALDALVADGAVSYANAFAQSPVCTPSRCSYMTGWYPHTHGHRSMKHMLNDHEPNLLTVLRGEGYHVWWGGKNDLVDIVRCVLRRGEAMRPGLAFDEAGPKDAVPLAAGEPVGELIGDHRVLSDIINCVSKLLLPPVYLVLYFV